MLNFLSVISVVGLFVAAVNAVCAMSPATVLHVLSASGIQM